VTLLDLLPGGFRDNPKEDSGCQRAGCIRIVFRGEPAADLFGRYESPCGDSADEGGYFAWSGHQYLCACRDAGVGFLDDTTSGLRLMFSFSCQDFRFAMALLDSG